MRQVGAEAAKKASDTKSQSRAKLLGVSQASNGTAEKADNSTGPGSPAPSGTTDAASAIVPEIGFTTAKSTADDAEITEVLTKLSEDSGLSGEGDSSSDGIVQSASQDLPAANEKSTQQKLPDEFSQAADQGLEGGNSDSKISREASEKGKLKTEGQEAIEREGEIKEGFESDSSKLKTVKASTDDI